MNEIKAGDIVQLKSGSSIMTVSRLDNINGVPNALCGWFAVKSNKKETSTFPVTMLKHIS